MKTFNFDGWDLDNGSCLNLVFGNQEDLLDFNAKDFLSLFDIDEMEDQGELQNFEYTEYYDCGESLKNGLLTFNGNVEKLEGFLDRFNVDYLWIVTGNEFKLIHNHTIEGNDFIEAKENFIDNTLINHVLITRVVSF